MQPFAFSNLSFLNENVPFASRERADIFSIRTLIDFGGIAILHAYQSRISEYVAEKELSVMNVMLKSQYDQYRNYQDSLDLIQMKYHDLKHQITGLRAESDEEKRKKWIDSMENEIAAFENISRTGNQVLIRFWQLRFSIVEKIIYRLPVWQMENYWIICM